MYRRIIHLSHTDIRFDSRILKEMRAAASLEGCSVLGVGFELSEGAATNPDAAECRLLTLKLVSRSWRMIPRALRYCFNCLELTFAILLALRNNRPTVVHCHDTLVLPVGWLAKAIFNCALVYDAHELESNKNGQGPLLSKITLLVERFCWKRVDLFISVSVQIVDWYKERLGDKTAIVILNSPEISAYKASAELTFENRYLRDRFRIPETSSIFVYVGYFGYGRGIDEYINVFEEVGDRAHLVFLGYGELLGHIASRVKSQSNMHIHPAVPHQDVVRVISGADVGLCMVEDVSLSDFLSLPNKLFEYAFARVRVLASDFPAIRAVVHQFHLGVCCAGGRSNLERTVQEMLDTRGKVPVHNLDELSWERQAAVLVQGYERLLRR